MLDTLIPSGLQPGGLRTRAVPPSDASLSSQRRLIASCSPTRFVSSQGQQFQVQRRAMQINHFIQREIIYGVLEGLQIQSPACSHCHVPCLGLSSVFIRPPAPPLPPRSPELRFIPQVIEYGRLHANRGADKRD